jgi:hypothetical protein
MFFTFEMLIYGCPYLLNYRYRLMELANCYSDETCSQDYSVIMTPSLMSHQLVVAAKIVQTVYNSTVTQLYNTLSDLHM